MKDTPKEVEDRFREMIMARSGEERLIMGCQMFDAARAIIIASLPKDLPDDEFKRLLFERIYGKPLDEVLHTVRDGPED
ncbi:MAG TPA: hypothetical protein VHE60_08170 [Pyrinomonadaceae bacterium]|nr:hypothetical protein [Pyrinomonadaceae bacterium]